MRIRPTPLSSDLQHNGTCCVERREDYTPGWVEDWRGERTHEVAGPALGSESSRSHSELYDQLLSMERPRNQGLGSGMGLTGFGIGSLLLILGAGLAFTPARAPFLPRDCLALKARAPGTPDGWVNARGKTAVSFRLGYADIKEYAAKVGRRVLQHGDSGNSDWR
jgi:hypothetical protein